MAGIKNSLRGVTQKWGTTRLKRSLWNKEFAEGRWAFIESTSNDVVYPILEKYCRTGSLLDLGCGSGNTGCELNGDSYQEYTGVDISDIAISKAKERSDACHRSAKNRYEQSDIQSYEPSRKYDVILFRESIYYIPQTRINSVLKRYAQCLKPGGVIVVRTHSLEAGEPILAGLGADFRIAEKSMIENGPLVAVLSPAGP